MRLSLLVALSVVLVGCGADKKPVPAACIGPALPIQQAALAGGPLPDGSRLSDCIVHANSDAKLSGVATALAAATDDLAIRAGRGDQQAAQALGFLIGATQRGADTNSTAAELARRLAADARRVHELAPEMDRLVTRGSAAGRARG